MGSVLRRDVVLFALGISAFVLDPCYLVLIYAFVRGRDWIRLPAIFYAGIPVIGSTLHLAVGLLANASLLQMACDGTRPGYDNRFTDTAKVLHPTCRASWCRSCWWRGCGAPASVQRRHAVDA